MLTGARARLSYECSRRRNDYVKVTGTSSHGHPAPGAMGCTPSPQAPAAPPLIRVQPHTARASPARCRKAVPHQASRAGYRRMERDALDKLFALYEQGYAEAARRWPALQAYLRRKGRLSAPASQRRPVPHERPTHAAPLPAQLSDTPHMRRTLHRSRRTPAAPRAASKPQGVASRSRPCRTAPAPPTAPRMRRTGGRLRGRRDPAPTLPRLEAP